MIKKMAIELLSVLLRHFPCDAVRWRLIPYALNWAKSSMPAEAVREVRTRHGFRMRIRIADWLGRHVFVRGEYEPETTAVLKVLLRQGATFLDVGANAGYFTLLASRLVGSSGRVLAFEPVPLTRQELVTNIRLNNVCNVTIFEQALSNQSGRANFSVGPPEHRGISSLRSLTDVSAKIEVETARLDDILPVQQKLDVIKIDVEGAEQLALQGMERALDRDHPDLIIEVTDQFLRSFGQSAVALCDMLSNMRYRMYAITQKGLVPFEPHQADSWSQYNALFTRRELLPSSLQVLNPPSMTTPSGLQ